MREMWSLSTCCLCNKYCQKQQAVKARGTKESICSGCFAVDIAARYPDGVACWTRNQETLTSQIIPVEDWPTIKKDVFRLESFGDLNNVTQVINYFNLAYANPGVSVALWTKHPHLIKRAIDQGYKKPENMIIIFSAFWVDHVARNPYPE